MHVVGNAANVCCSVLNGESADVPDGIVVDWSLRFPRYTPKAMFSVDDAVMHCRMWIRVFRGVHVIK